MTQHDPMFTTVGFSAPLLPFPADDGFSPVTIRLVGVDWGLGPGELLNKNWAGQLTD